MIKLLYSEARVINHAFFEQYFSDLDFVTAKVNSKLCLI